MLSLLRLNPSYALASTFKLKPSVLYVATRHFLTTSPGHSPTQKTSNKASAKQSTVRESDTKSKEASADLAKEKLPAKPKKFRKKDLIPPSKKPMASFASFAAEYRAKKMHNTDTHTSIPLVDTLREAASEWAKLSEAEKKTYAPSREAVEAHRVALKNWRDSLSVEAKRALKVRLRRKTGTGHSLFLSETFKEAKGDNFGEKISDRAAAWKLLPSEVKEDYAKRAAETLFGSRAKRAAQHERQVKKAADAKAAQKLAAKEKKEKMKALQEAKKIKLKESKAATKSKKAAGVAASSKKTVTATR